MDSLFTTLFIEMGGRAGITYNVTGKLFLKTFNMNIECNTFNMMILLLWNCPVRPEEQTNIVAVMQLVVKWTIL